MNYLPDKQLARVQNVRKSLIQCRDSIESPEKRKQLEEYIQKLGEQESKIYGYMNPVSTSSLPEVSSKEIPRPDFPNSMNDFRVFADLNRNNPSLVREEMNKRFDLNADTQKVEQELQKLDQNRANAAKEVYDSEIQSIVGSMLPEVKYQVGNFKIDTFEELQSFISVYISKKVDEKYKKEVSYNLAKMLFEKKN